MADLLTLLALLVGLVFIVQSNASPQELADTVREFVQNLFRRDAPSAIESQNRDESAPIGDYERGLGRRGRRGRSPVWGNMREEQLAREDRETPIDETEADNDSVLASSETGRTRDRVSWSSVARRGTPLITSLAFAVVRGERYSGRRKRKREG